MALMAEGGEGETDEGFGGTASLTGADKWASEPIISASELKWTGKEEEEESGLLWVWQSNDSQSLMCLVISLKKACAWRCEAGEEDVMRARLAFDVAGACDMLLSAVTPEVDHVLLTATGADKTLKLVIEQVINPVAGRSRFSELHMERCTLDAMHRALCQYATLCSTTATATATAGGGGVAATDTLAAEATEEIQELREKLEELQEKTLELSECLDEKEEEIARLQERVVTLEEEKKEEAAAAAATTTTSKPTMTWDTTLTTGDCKPERWIVSEDGLTVSKVEGKTCNTSIMCKPAMRSGRHTVSVRFNSGHFWFGFTDAPHKLMYDSSNRVMRDYNGCPVYGHGDQFESSFSLAVGDVLQATLDLDAEMVTFSVLRKDGVAPIRTTTLAWKPAALPVYAGIVHYNYGSPSPFPSITLV